MKSIGEEIVQSNFTSEYQKLLVNLIYTHNFLTDKLNSMLKSFDITRQQFNVLRILRGQYPNPVSQVVIKERMLDKMSDTSRLIDRLLLKNWIERSYSDIDRRMAQIKISKDGLALLEKTDPLIKDFEKQLKNLSKGEAAQLNILLDKLRDQK